MRNFSLFAASLTAGLLVSLPVMANGNPPSPVQLILNEIDAAASMTAPSNEVRSPIGLNQVSQRKTLGLQNKLAATSFKQSLKVEGKNTKKHEGVDLVRLGLGRNAARHKALEDKLTATYGTPRSRRGGTQIWEIQNNDKGYDQSKTITIMSGQEAGNYFVTIDRRGNTGRTAPPSKASFAAPRAVIAPRPSTPKRPEIDYSIRD